MSLPKEVKSRIRKESIEYSSLNMDLKLAYKAGAETEAERSMKLVEVLRSILSENPNPTLPVNKIIKRLAEDGISEYYNQK